MYRHAIALIVTLFTVPLLPAIAPAQAAAITEEEAHAIGVDAYLYFYSPVTMDLTRKQLTNQEPTPGGIGGPMNTLRQCWSISHRRHARRGAAEFRYALFERLARFDQGADGRLSARHRRPLLPPAHARHVDRRVRFPGLAHHGDGSGQLPRHASRLAPDLREKFVEEFRLPDNTQRIDAPTPYVWIIGRTKTDGPADYDAVHKIQDGYKITPLSQWGKEPVEPEVKIDPSIDMKTPPKVAVDTMKAGTFFAYAAELLKLHPPHITDQPIIARLKRIGFEVGKSFDLDKADPAVQKGLASAPEDAQKLMAWKVPTLARIANGWSMNTDTMGVYGNYYLKRAIVTQFGLGANLPSDAIYPLNLADDTGKPLDGASNYTIHFDKSEIPPVDAFWSITLYDLEGFQVANSLNRFAVSSWMPFKYQSRRLARSLFPEREPRRGQGSELAASAEGSVQPHHAPLRAEERCADRQMEPTAGGEGASRAYQRPIVA